MKSNLKDLSILYVEDDFLAQQNIAKILELLFDKVYLASDGKQALKIFDEENIHIVLTDYEMPLINGYELVKEIRKISEEIPIIILSNYTEKEKLLKCIPLKLTDYVEKPIKYDLLLESLNRCLEQIKKCNLLEFTLSKDMKYNVLSKKIYKDECAIPLTAHETKVFEYLFQKRGSLVYKEEISTIINSEEDYNENSVKNLIYRLRKKLGKDLIQNLKFIGYSLKINE